MKATRLFVSSVCLFIVLSLVLNLAESRGGRGGGFRSGFRSSRYRSSRISKVPVRYKYSGYRLGSSQLKKAAILAGTVYGARLWMRRSTYRLKQTYPEVCYNDIYEGNATVKYYGRFVCPGYDNPDSYRYCCGSVGTQYCCDNPFDPSSSQGAGRIAGIVIGVIFAVIVVGVLAYCCFKKRHSFAGKTLSRDRNSSELQYHSPTDTVKTSQPMGGYTATPPLPSTMTYGVQPMATDGTPPPPYSDPSYKPTMPTEDINRDDLPYGLTPDPGTGYTYGQQVPANGTPYPPGEPTGYPPPSGPAPYPAYPPPPAGNPYPQ